MAGGIRDRAERLRIAEPRRNFLRFLVDHPGDGKCLALNRDGDVPAPITLREEQAALLQRLRKSRAVVRHGPAFLNGCLNLFRSVEHMSELQSLMRISYPVFCLKYIH